MAKTVNPSYLKEINGRMGDAVFYRSGNKQCIRIYVIPRNPRTEIQQKNRPLFAEAMASWKTLPDEEKYLFRIRAGELGMHPHNLYVREYMVLHPEVYGIKSDCSGTMSSKSIIKTGGLNRGSINPPIILRNCSEVSPFILPERPSSYKIKQENRGG